MADRENARNLIARLAVAVMTADGRVTQSEYRESLKLEYIGLGSFAGALEAELRKAVSTPIDLGATCAALGPVTNDEALIIITILASVGAVDAGLSPEEVTTLRTIGALLRLGDDDMRRVIGTVSESAPAPRTEKPAPTPAPPPSEPTIDPRVAQACQMLGVAPNASHEQIDRAYLELAQRYSPNRVVELGIEFVVLAARTLGEVTDAYELLRSRAVGRRLAA